MLLGGVVAAGVLGGRGAADPPSAEAGGSARPSVVAVVADAVAVPTPSRRSDWPAAIGRAGTTIRPAGSARHREEGTDGLMGGRPFGIPGDTPYPAAEHEKRLYNDDVAPGPGLFRDVADPAG